MHWNNILLIQTIKQSLNIDAALEVCLLITSVWAHTDLKIGIWAALYV